MDIKKFDEITRGLMATRSRRQLAGGLLAGAALLTGATALEAKPGKSKGKAKGKGKGTGRPKVQICHRRKKGEGFKLINVGGPAAKAHRKHNGDVVCEPSACQTVANGCAEDGACTFELAADGTECLLPTEELGECTAGVCGPVESDPPVEE